MIPCNKCSAACFAIAILWLPWALAKEYARPDPRRLGIDATALKIETGEREQIVGWLTAVARNLPAKKVSPQLRGKALGLALLLSPRDRDALVANGLLSKGHLPTPVKGLETEPSAIAVALSNSSEGLLKSASGLAQTRFANGLADIAAEVDSGNPVASYQAGVARENGQLPDWEEAFRRAPVAGGFGKFAIRQSAVRVAVLAGGKVELVPLTIEVHDAPLRDGLEADFSAVFSPKMKNPALLEPAIEFLTAEHVLLPRSRRGVLSLESENVPENWRAETLAAALLIDGLITGSIPATDFVITGEIDAFGTVLPVDSLGARLKAIRAQGVPLAVVPTLNEVDLEDLLIWNGPRLLCRVQIFGVTSFNQARGLSVANRSRGVLESILLFDAVRSRLGLVPKAAGLQRESIAGLLRAVVAKEPNHLSARVLLTAAEGRLRRHLSIRGSLVEIDGVAGDLIRNARSLGTRSFGRYPKSSVDKSSSLFIAVRKKIDPRLVPYLNRTEELGRAIRRYLEHRSEQPNVVNDYREAAVAAYLRWWREDQKVARGVE